MKKVTIKYRRCAKCGKVIRYKLIEDDGRDWMGHHWGKEESYTVGYDCDCESSISQQDHLGTNFNFKSQICTDKIQSERLLSLGLKKETADCCYLWHWESDSHSLYAASWEHLHRTTSDIPAWSLHRLLEMNLNSTDTRFEVRFNQLDVKDAYEILLAHIEWLIKEGYFPKEYLDGLDSKR